MSIRGWYVCVYMCGCHSKSATPSWPLKPGMAQQMPVFPLWSEEGHVTQGGGTIALGNAAVSRHPSSHGQSLYPALGAQWQLPASNGKAKVSNRRSGIGSAH